MTDIYSFDSVTQVPDPIHVLPVNDLSSNVLVADNGSYMFRIGWSHEESPRFKFRSLALRQHFKKEFLVGNDIQSLDSSKAPPRSPFEVNIASRMETQEHVLDHAFQHLGFEGEPSVSCPILLTEPPGSPAYYRQFLTELMFESYGVPKLAFGIDALFSLHLKLPSTKDALVLSVGHSSSHVLALLNGQLQLSRSRRINLGGLHLTQFMLQLMQLKYPVHLASLSATKAEELLHKHSFLANGYQDEIRCWADSEYYDKFVHIMQLPISQEPGGQLPLTGMTSGGRKGFSRSQLEADLKRRAQTIQRSEAKLSELLSIQEQAEQGRQEKFRNSLELLGFKSLSELQAAILQLRTSVQIQKAEERCEAKRLCNEQVNTQQADDFTAKTMKTQMANLSQLYQLHVGTERIRVPELFFQPSMMGMQQAGLSETMNSVLKLFTADEQQHLVQSVYLTGGCAQIPGFSDRIRTDLLEMRPFQSTFNVVLPGDPSITAWCGAARWSRSEEAAQSWITKQEYDECGESRASLYHRHSCGNPS